MFLSLKLVDGLTICGIWEWKNHCSKKEVLFVVCQCLSYLQRLGIDSVQFLKLLMEEITCCNLCIKCQYKNGQPKKNVLLRWISKPADSSCRIFVLLPRVFVLEIYGGDHFQMVMPICSWIGTHPNPTEPAVAAFFLFRQVSLFSLFQMAFLKRKSNSFSFSAEKRGHPIWLKNGSINEENHTIGIV